MKAVQGHPRTGCQFSEHLQALHQDTWQGAKHVQEQIATFCSSLHSADAVPYLKWLAPGRRKNGQDSLLNARWQLIGFSCCGVVCEGRRCQGCHFQSLESLACLQGRVLLLQLGAALLQLPCQALNYCDQRFAAEQGLLAVTLRQGAQDLGCDNTEVSVRCQSQGCPANVIDRLAIMAALYLQRFAESQSQGSVNRPDAPQHAQPLIPEWPGHEQVNLTSCQAGDLDSAKLLGVASLRARSSSPGPCHAVNGI